MSQGVSILDLLGIDLPILLSPMAGPGTPDLCVAVSEEGGLGSLPCAMLSIDEMRAQVGIVRQRTNKPFNLNFFCHKPRDPDPAREIAWKTRLRPYYDELGLDALKPAPQPTRAPFDEAWCDALEDIRPPVVSFHFGLPGEALMRRVKALGAKVLSSATTVEEASWLQAAGVDAIIAQGSEAGGHRGMFLTEDVSKQIGLFALLPQIADAVSVPVIAAGGIADERGVAAAFALGASAVQVGTAYLFCQEARVSSPHCKALHVAASDATVLTNVFTGRPARGIENRLVSDLGPLAIDVPPFPHAAAPLAPLRSASEALGHGDFTPLWSGQGARLCRETSARELTRVLANGWAQAQPEC